MSNLLRKLKIIDIGIVTNFTVDEIQLKDYFDEIFSDLRRYDYLYMNYMRMSIDHKIFNSEAIEFKNSENKVIFSYDFSKNVLWIPYKIYNHLITNHLLEKIQIENLIRYYIIHKFSLKLKINTVFYGS